MNKYINLGMGFGLIIATTSAFGLSLSAKIEPQAYYCNGTDYLSCSVTQPAGFIPGTANFSTAVTTALTLPGSNGIIPPLVGLLANGQNTIWSTTNTANPSSAPHQLLISMPKDPSNPSNSLKALPVGSSPSSIGITAYYVPCSTDLPKDAVLASSVSGSTLITETGISLLNTTASCTVGGNIYFALAPINLVNNLLPATTYSGTVTLTVASN